MKYSTILLSVLLAGCVNPEYERPWENGPTYYKVPECVTLETYPREYRRFDPTTGLYDTYRSFGPNTQVHCNYNPMTTAPVENLNVIYLYGHEE